MSIDSSDELNNSGDGMVNNSQKVCILVYYLLIKMSFSKHWQVAWKPIDIYIGSDMHLELNKYWIITDHYNKIKSQQTSISLTYVIKQTKTKTENHVIPTWELKWNDCDLQKYSFKLLLKYMCVNYIYVLQHNIQGVSEHHQYLRILFLGVKQM